MPPAGTSCATPTRAGRFPRTRYQGSKRKLAPVILDHLLGLPFGTALDAFGGTGAISYSLKTAGKRVTYNDILRFNHLIAVGLIENDSARLSREFIGRVGERHADTAYDDLIERTFEGIYFTTEENRWLDAAAANIRRLSCRFQRALAWFALFQSAIAKRPYNLFHRRNLYMRTADVQRGFGNKASWDRSFSDHFAVFAAEANAAVVDTGGNCRALRCDALGVPTGYDLVYIDPPYINAAGVGVDYRDFYHFLEGIVQYDQWGSMIDHDSAHRRLQRTRSPWTDSRLCHEAFRLLLTRFSDSILVISYRSDGIPSIDQLAEMLREVKTRVRIVELHPYQYALSTRRKTREVLLIGQ